MEARNNKTEIRITEGKPADTVPAAGDNRSMKERIKKPLIFVLMGVVFLGCMWLIFKPKGGGQEGEKSAGLNEVVPQATDTGLPADKQKAYEMDMLEQKAREKKDALLALSDYWNTGEVSGDTLSVLIPDEGYRLEGNSGGGRSNVDEAMESYRSVQHTLGSFYDEDDSRERELRKEIQQLRSRLDEQEEPRPGNSIENQLELMEKSYQMAARYLPMNQQAGTPFEGQQVGYGASGPVAGGTKRDKETIVSFVPDRNTTVSALYREPTDSAFLAQWSGERNSGFRTPGGSGTFLPRNSVRACIHETQTVSAEGVVKLRMLESARTPNYIIPKGTILTAFPKLNAGRLTLEIRSIEMNGNIIPVEISVYDLDGQQGLYVPYSPEVGAAQGILANMGNTAGSGVTLNSSAGQQLTSDLTKSVVNGVSGYFAKKVTSPKITLKAGHRLFLLSLKQ